MTLNTPLRFVLVFLLTVLVGGGVVYFSLRGDRVEPRRGIRIPTATGEEPVPDSPVPGIPVVRHSEGAEYSRYEKASFLNEKGETETYEYLSAHLKLEQAFPMELRAENVLVRIYPAPVDLAQARVLGETPAVPTVSIDAGKAKLKGVFRETKEAGGAASEWELYLVDGVDVVSKEKGAKATLTADELTCYPEERRIIAARGFKLNAEGYSVEGQGLSGHAGLGTFVVEKNPVVTIPTAAILGDLAEGESTTVITCAGPLLVQRLDSGDGGEWVPSRVEFRNQVQVIQKGPSGEDRISADSLVIELDVRAPGSEDESPSRARVRELIAIGSVVLETSGGGRAMAAKIRVIPGEPLDRIELTGPTRFHHRGVLAEGEPEGLVEFSSEGTGVVLREREAGTFTVEFEGGVSARRLDLEKRELLRLTAQALTFESDADSRRMTATGNAHFSSQGVEGEAHQITWKQVGEAKTEIRLIKDAQVTADAGANLDPFAAAETKAEEPGEDTVIILTAEGSLELDQEGEARTFRLIDGAMIRRITDKEEMFRVTADLITASVEGAGVGEVKATGSVVAGGRPRMASGEGEQVVDLVATGDTFVFSGGKAVLSGGPAEARIRESGDEWNRIAGSKLSFATPKEGSETPGSLFVEGDVAATVYLAGKKGGKTRGFTLTCGRLEIVPAPDKMAGEHQEETGASGRIDSITAEEAVVLDGVEWIAKGERLTYSGRGGKVIVLTGKPARMERRQKLLGKVYDDLFTADRIFVRLVDKKLQSFSSPTGGKLLLHRLAGKGDEGPNLMGGGEGSGDAEGRIERFEGGSSGELTYDKQNKQARMEKDALIVQSILKKGKFVLVARFSADLVQGWLEEGPDGDDRLSRAEGRGKVKGNGEDWLLTCTAFEVDFRNQLTIITGKPARVEIEGAVNEVERAEYNYGSDEWEFYRVTTR